MEQRRPIADGQEAVFQVSEPPTLETPQRNPRLWCLLVCPVFLIIVLLAISINSLWRDSLGRGLDRQAHADREVLSKFKNSSNEILTTMVDYLQHTTAEAAVREVATYTNLPETVVNLNVENFQNLPLAEPSRIDYAMQTMWWQTTELFPDVGCVFYADQSGLYVGYERLPVSFLQHMNVTGLYTFGAEFSPPQGQPLPECSYCPPKSLQRHGEKTYYFVDHEGKYTQVYERHPYDPRQRDWYKMAVAAKGAMTWTRIYNHSSGNSMGTSAQRAIMQGSEVLGVAAGDFTVNLVSHFLEHITRRFAFEEGFILNVDTGLMVACSLGRSYVARPVSPEDNQGLVRYHWNDIQDPMVQSPIRTLQRKFNGSLHDAAQHGQTMTSDDGRYLFTYTLGAQASFQAHHGWLVVITCPISSYMKESWQQQAWAKQKSEDLREELQHGLLMHQVNTMLLCASIALLAVIIMGVVGFIIARPLRRISLDMLSMAKLEFLSSDRSDCDQERVSHRRTRFLSFDSLRHVTHALSNLRSRSKTNTASSFSHRSPDTGGFTDPHTPEELTDEDVEAESMEEGNWSEREYEKERLEEDIGPSRGCARLSTPKEVIDMRESFAFMVAGLRSFARYLDPEIMRMLVQSRRQAQLGMGRAEVTIFFSDIANFTTMAESLEPEVFMSMLTEYLDEMSKIIMAKHGVVGEFIGDAIMAWWNVPVDLGPEHTCMALDAALTQQRRLLDLRNAWEQRGLPEVRVRMGLVRGDVLAGNIGSSQRMKYGLVGDSVNLASRLESLCKYYGVSAIIEQDAASAPRVRERFRLRLLDWVIVKGRTQATNLFQLLADKDELPEKLHSIQDLQFFMDGFAEIHRLYRAKSFERCAKALRSYSEHFPFDAPSKMLLRRVETLLTEGIPPNWTPVHTLVEK